MVRVFPKRTKWTPDDELAFVGFPPVFRPPEQKVRISVTFTPDLDLGYRLLWAWGKHYKDVRIAGPALGDPGGLFMPGCFVKQGVTITSRGCIKQCGWCYVPKREGTIREIPIEPGHIVQDNNLLACSRGHVERVFDMLRSQRRGAIFSGGLDIFLLQPWHRELIDSIRLSEIWVACDVDGAMPALDRAAKIFSGIPVRKLRCYVMVGFNGETPDQASRRLERVFELGFLPFCQMYQGDHPNKVKSKEWRALLWKWSRPAVYRHKDKTWNSQTSIDFSSTQKK